MYTIVHISHIFLYLQTSYARGSCRQVLHLAPALWAFRAAPHPFLEWLVPDAKCSGLTIEVNPVLTSANPWRTSLSHLPPADGQSISESKYGDLQKGQSDNGSLQFTPVHPLEKEAQHAQTASKLQRASPQPITLWIQHLGLDWHSIRAQNSPKIRSLRMQIMIRSVPATTHSNPKTYYTNKEGIIGLPHAQKLLYIDHHWPMTCQFSSAQARDGQTATLSKTWPWTGMGGRLGWLILARPTSKEPTFDAGKETVEDVFLMRFCICHLTYIGKLEVNTWLITRNLIDNLRYSQLLSCASGRDDDSPNCGMTSFGSMLTAGVKKIWSAFLHWSILKLQKAAAINKAASEK